MSNRRICEIEVDDYISKMWIDRPDPTVSRLVTVVSTYIIALIKYYPGHYPRN